MGKRTVQSIIQARESKHLKMKERLSSASRSKLPRSRSKKNTSQSMQSISNVDGRQKNVGRNTSKVKGVGGSMKKMRKTTLDSYTIPGTRKIVKAGDCVLIQAPPQRANLPYVAKVEKIERTLDRTSTRENTVVKVRWFYHPEETICGRRSFHGEQEVCLSDHYDTQDADCIQEKCKVYIFDEYCKLKEVGRHDYFWRFEYKAALKILLPENVDVYCVCEMPYNPDHFVVQCEACNDWFHPRCVKLSQEQVANMEAYVCAQCSDDDSHMASRGS